MLMEQMAGAEVAKIQSCITFETGSDDEAKFGGRSSDT